MKTNMVLLSSLQKRRVQSHGWKNLIICRLWQNNRMQISYSRNLSSFNSFRKVFNYNNFALNSYKNSNNFWFDKTCRSFEYPRLISTSLQLHHGDDELKDIPETVRVIFISKDGTKQEVMGKVGERAMYLAHRKGIDMEGACEASLACTTCHCYVDSTDEHWDLLPEASEKEEDLLDMAPFLDVNSRLGCQIILAPEIDGIVLRLPRATKNFYVEGHKPQPH